MSDGESELVMRVTRWMATVPAEVAERIRDRGVVEIGRALGPSFVAIELKKQDLPLSIHDALAWLAPRPWRRCHLVLDDGAFVWFEPVVGFWKYEDQSGRRR